MFQCYSLKPCHLHLLPWSPKVCSLYLCRFCCLAYKVIITIFLNSIFMHILYWYFSFWLTSLCIVGSRFKFHHLIRTDSNESRQFLTTTCLAECSLQLTLEDTETQRSNDLLKIMRLITTQGRSSKTTARAFSPSALSAKRTSGLSAVILWLMSAVHRRVGVVFWKRTSYFTMDFPQPSTNTFFLKTW